MSPTKPDGKTVFTNASGCPIFSPYASQQIGTPGPLLLQDNYMIELLAHFDRERIPERVVHAKGHGAFGEFEVTHDVTDLTCADFLSSVGKKTPIVSRFSTVGGESGSADSARDPRGFSVKLYTDEGILDWVYNNTPIFFIRNPAKFPTFIHTQKRNPQTHLKDPNMFWDFLVQNPESLHQVMILFSDRGTPKASRFMHGFSGHTYKWVKKDGTFNYVQIHCLTDQGIKNWNNEESTSEAGTNPDYAMQDLFDTIERKEFPSWTCYVQVMSPEQAEKLDFSVFDLTKTWPHKDFPLRPFGKFTLNRNPTNYFQDIEQAAFSPNNMVPGWEPSADPVLQSRLFSYPDTQRHRLGANYQQIPVNRCPVAHAPFQRDGPMQMNNLGEEPNYPSSFWPLKYSQQPANVGIAATKHEQWVGTASAFHWSDDGDYRQCTAFWEVLKKTGQDKALIHNIAGHAGAAKPEVRHAVVEYFSKASPEIGELLTRAFEQ
ncbi:catalase A [Starmerella bacillaris]|uniref:Catalase A n=1 Tax=Starmerella bacillaris TaxID=1247836 RepID=A0AAV5RI94_STABA|nr:catalase A [Starmerella bacillaris]